MKSKNAPYNQIKDFTDLKDMIYKNSVEFENTEIIRFLVKLQSRNTIPMVKPDC